MISAVLAASLVAPLLADPPSGAPDRIALVRKHAHQQKQPTSLWVHGTGGPIGDFVGQVGLADESTPPAAGKKPLREVYAADWDGDGRDELILVKQMVKTKSKRLRLYVHRLPDQLWEEVGKAVASTAIDALGADETGAKVVRTGVLDADGDGRDELLLVRQAQNGAQSLEIRSLPQGLGKGLGPYGLADVTFGQAGSDQNVFLFGATAPSGPAVVAVRRNGQGKERLEVYVPPTSAFGETGPPVASYQDVTAPAGWQNVAFQRIRSGLPDDPDEVVITQVAADGSSRLRVHPLPASAGQVLGAPILTDASPGHLGAGAPLLAAFGVRESLPGAVHVPTLNGKFHVSFRYGDPEEPSVLGPFQAYGLLQTTPGAGAKWQLAFGSMTPLSVLNGTLEQIGVKHGATMDFKETGIDFVVPFASGPAIAGDRIRYAFPTGTLAVDECGFVTVEGDFIDGQPHHLTNPAGATKLALIGFACQRVPWATW